MSWIEKRNITSGTRYRVCWRDDTARTQVETFADEESAIGWKTILDANGAAIARSILAAGDTGDAPTVTWAVKHHIEHLTDVEPGTRRDYERILREHIATTIGPLPVTALTRDHVAAWVNTQAGTVTPKTIKNRHTLLSAALTSAMYAGQIPRNVAKGVKMPASGIADEMCFLTQEEFSDLVRAAEIHTPHWRSLVLFLGATGMRWGEASALQARHIDLKHGEIRILQAWKETRGHGHRLGPPKTKMGRRTIPVPTICRPDLERAIAGLGADEFVFRNTQGRVVRHAAFYESCWQTLIHYYAGDQREIYKPARGRSRVIWHETGEGKRPRIHDLRHSYASWAISAGHSLLAVQRVLGHESVTSTSDRYGHLIRADRDAFSDLLQPVQSRPPLPAA